MLVLQGTECPESGFCGVQTCGAWSSGSTDQGVPCTGAVGPPSLPSPPPPPLPGVELPVVESNITLEPDTTAGAAGTAGKPNAPDPSRSSDTAGAAENSASTRARASPGAALVTAAGLFAALVRL